MASVLLSIVVRKWLISKTGVSRDLISGKPGVFFQNAGNKQPWSVTVMRLPGNKPKSASFAIMGSGRARTGIRRGTDRHLSIPRLGLAGTDRFDPV